MFRSSNLLKTAFMSSRLKHLSTNYKNAIRHMSNIATWNKNWQPGPYPRTQEERVAAAKKYNMIPEDYEPYPEEEGFGDYPMFRKVHMETRNPHEPFDWESTKRNFGEPVHPDFDMCIEDKINFDRKFRTPLWKQFLYLTTGVTLYVAIITWDISNPIDRKLIPKQYPNSGQVHYSFESE